MKVKITNDRFEPGHIVVNVGTEVEWRVKNDENGSTSTRKKAYVVSFDSIPEESDPLRNSSDSFNVVFDKAGVYKYRCSI